ncbi:lipoprotein [Salinisphaera shabanensis T35B1]|uniref:hypothetical protein n=1 Tax=Salinisphaera shabanensis TaxID=180542 RepID=UPI0033427517
MATKKKKAGIAIVAVLVLTAGAVIAMKAAQPEAAESATLVSNKHAQLASIESYNEGQNSFSESFNPIIRDRTLRDSGRKSVGLFIKNVYFRVVGDVAFDTKQLSAVLIPRNAGDPIVLDDPTSFIFHPLHGQVTLPPKALSALFNQYLADYSGSQLRKIEASTGDDGRLIVEGEAAKIPGVWLPFHMAGTVELKQGHLFVYKPDEIKLGPMEAKGLLEAINLQLSKLLQIESQGAGFSGNNVVLDLNHALPPPEQSVNVERMQIDSAGVHLDITSDQNPDFPEPVVNSDSYVMLQGGDVRIQRAVITDARLQLMARDGGKLDASLYNYRAQLVNGVLDATPSGEIAIYLGSYVPEDYIEPALPEDSDAS